MKRILRAAGNRVPNSRVPNNTPVNTPSAAEMGEAVDSPKSPVASPKATVAPATADLLGLDNSRSQYSKFSDTRAVRPPLSGQQQQRQPPQQQTQQQQQNLPSSHQRMAQTKISAAPASAPLSITTVQSDLSAPILTPRKGRVDRMLPSPAPSPQGYVPPKVKRERGGKNSLLNKASLAGRATSPDRSKSPVRATSPGELRRRAAAYNVFSSTATERQTKSVSPVSLPDIHNPFVNNERAHTSPVTSGILTSYSAEFYDDEGSDTETDDSLSERIPMEEGSDGNLRQRNGHGQKSSYHRGGDNISPISPAPHIPSSSSLIAHSGIVYEERYGDSYVGASLKYIYPAGYTSMRPRGGPWKLSLVIFTLFCWISVFIVGHCSERVQNSQSQQGYKSYNGNEYGDDIYGGQYVKSNSEKNYDDEAYMLETHWCGKSTLYSMWVLSGVVTGLSGAYCAIIGYIKVRDFAVANGRSQPPKVDGKSDYYVRVRNEGSERPVADVENSTDSRPSVNAADVTTSVPTYQTNGGRHYRSSIYQSDGTPQFWGEFIYHPNQAAVAVTSR